MLMDLTKVQHLFIRGGKTDMRKGVDGLAALILDQYDLNLFDDALFLFCGSRQDRYKGLYFDQDGFVLLYKRLENGRLQWPRNEEEIQKLTPQELRWLLEGLSIQQPKAIKPAQLGELI